MLREKDDLKCTIPIHAISDGIRILRVAMRVSHKISGVCHFGSHENWIALQRNSELVSGAGTKFVPSSLVNRFLQLDSTEDY